MRRPKDTPGTWSVQEPTGYTYDISAECACSFNETITSGVGGQTLATLMDFYEASTLMYWQIANVSGATNAQRAASSPAVRLVSPPWLSMQPTVKVATYDTQLSGYGEMTVGA